MRRLMFLKFVAALLGFRTKEIRRGCRETGTLNGCITYAPTTDYELTVATGADIKPVERNYVGAPR